MLCWVLRLLHCDQRANGQPKHGEVRAQPIHKPLPGNAADVLEAPAMCTQIQQATLTHVWRLSDLGTSTRKLLRLSHKPVMLLIRQEGCHGLGVCGAHVAIGRNLPVKCDNYRIRCA